MMAQASVTRRYRFCAAHRLHTRLAAKRPQDALESLRINRGRLALHQDRDLGRPQQAKHSFESVALLVVEWAKYSLS